MSRRVNTDRDSRIPLHNRMGTQNQVGDLPVQINPSSCITNMKQQEGISVECQLPACRQMYGLHREQV